MCHTREQSASFSPSTIVPSTGVITVTVTGSSNESSESEQLFQPLNCSTHERETVTERRHVAVGSASPQPGCVRHGGNLDCVRHGRAQRISQRDRGVPVHQHLWDLHPPELCVLPDLQHLCYPSGVGGGVEVPAGQRLRGPREGQHGQHRAGVHLLSGHLLHRQLPAICSDGGPPAGGVPGLLRGPGLLLGAGVAHLPGGAPPGPPVGGASEGHLLQPLHRPGRSHVHPPQHRAAVRGGHGGVGPGDGVLLPVRTVRCRVQAHRLPSAHRADAARPQEQQRCFGPADGVVAQWRGTGDVIREVTSRGGS